VVKLRRAIKLGTQVSLIFLLIGRLDLSSAQSQTVDDVGTWTAIFAQDHIKGLCEERPLKWWFDGHLRFLDDTNGFHQSLIRPGVGLPLSDDLTAWVGYAWIHTDPVVGNEFDEHRLWQQTTWSKNRDLATFALRSRLEQRFMETGDDLGWRYRQLIRLQRAMPNHPQLSFVTWDEIFFNLNDTDFGARTGFDQNRAFVGFGWKPHADSRWRTEIGYLHQAINNPLGIDRANHILSVNFYH